MSFLLTAEQEAIRKTARGFVAERLPLSQLRRWRCDQAAGGWSRSVWQELGELGLLGMHLPEAHGGAGLGFTELGLVLEELGRTLAATPALSSLVLSAGLLARAGSPEQQAAELPGVCAGTRILALAHEEQRHFAPYAVATSAQRAGSGWVLRGEKCFVIGGYLADLFLVLARTHGAPGERQGLSLFLVPSASSGVEVQRLSLVDARNTARVGFRAVQLGPEALLGELDAAAEVLDPVLDTGAIALAAEMLGGAQQAFELALAYLKERRQFGVPIGSFQALKHRAAKLFCELELSKSVVMDGLVAIDEQRETLSRVACAVKARLNDAFMLVAAEAVQFHGGIGVTDEHDIGLYYKRAHSARQQLGGSGYHRDRYARLSGY